MRPLARAKLDSLDLLDRLDRLRRRHDPLVPPRRMIFVGPGDFRATGEEFFALFRRAGLRPEHDVLDVGSGLGRMAIPMTGWLRGRYAGFEIVREGVEWCERNITTRHPSFSFTHVDLYNGTYNPDGRLRAESFAFPYGDESFDFALLTSVFTHMLPADVRHYLDELRRVLRPGGTVLATYFLLDDASLGAVAEGRSCPSGRATPTSSSASTARSASERPRRPSPTPPRRFAPCTKPPGSRWRRCGRVAGRVAPGRRSRT